MFHLRFRIASSNGVSRNAGSRIYFRITLPKRKLYKVVKIEISKSALLDIQPTLLCACGVDSFIPHLPELEHLIGKPLNVFTFSIPQQTRKPVGELGGTPGGFAVEMKLRSRSTYSKFGRANPFRRDYFDYLTNEAKSELWPMLKTCSKLRPRLREGGPKSILLPV